MTTRRLSRLQSPPTAPRDVELAPEEAPPIRLRMVALRPDDKELFDKVQDFLAWREGRRFAQWDVFTIILAEALEKDGGRVAAALRRG